MTMSDLTERAKQACRDTRRTVSSAGPLTICISPMAAGIVMLRASTDRGMLKRKDVPVERVHDAARAMLHEYDGGNWCQYQEEHDDGEREHAQRLDPHTSPRPTTKGVLPVFDRDSQLCECGHSCGTHASHYPDGTFAGIGLGRCGYAHNRRFDPDLDLVDPPCTCQAFSLKQQT